jgi:hypothetical protein
MGAVTDAVVDETVGRGEREGKTVVNAALTRKRGRLARVQRLCRWSKDWRWRWGRDVRVSTFRGGTRARWTLEMLGCLLLVCLVMVTSLPSLGMSLASLGDALGHRRRRW